MGEKWGQSGVGFKKPYVPDRLTLCCSLATPTLFDSLIVQQLFAVQLKTRVDQIVLARYLGSQWQLQFHGFAKKLDR